METSGISGSAKEGTLLAAVQVNVLKKSQDMKAQEVGEMLKSIQSVSPTHLGANLDVTR